MTHIKQKVGRCETIEVSILNANSTTFKFSDNESTLQDVILEGIIVHTDALGFSKNGRTMLPLANLKKSLLTLSTNKQVLVIKDLPLETLLINDNAITWLKPFKIDIAKSQVTIPDASALALPAGPPAGYAIMITMFYRPFDAAKDRVDGDGYVIEN